MVDFPEQIGTVAKVASPFGRINIYVTLFFLAFLIIYFGIQSIHQHSVYPLFNGIIFQTIGADHKLSQELDNLPVVLTVGHYKIFSTQWFSYWWHMIILFLDVIMTIWFLYVILYGLYRLFSFVNIESQLTNWVYAIVFFLILQILVGLAIYPTTLAGQKMPNDKVKILNDAFKNSYPFEGMIKLISRIIHGDIFDKIYAFTASDLGKIVTGIPSGNGTGI